MRRFLRPVCPMERSLGVPITRVPCNFASKRRSVTCACSVLSCVQLLAPPWIVASQAPLSMAFSRQEYLTGLPFPSPGNPSNPGIKSMTPALAGNSIPLSHLGSVSG